MKESLETDLCYFGTGIKWVIISKHSILLRQMISKHEGRAKTCKTFHIN